jgi:hypothetical protein
MKSKQICKIKGCDIQVRAKKHQLCSAHLYQYYRKGEVKTGKVREYKSHKSFLEKTN